MDDVHVSGVMAIAVGIGSGALVLMLGTVAWGFAKIVEYIRLIARSAEQVHRQLRLMNDTLDEIQRDLKAKDF
jgi:uncharacterized membrane protein